jgi:glycine/D-amino acid oxidase-like deaminating enzyme
MTNTPIWGEDSAGISLPALEGDIGADVCVVGLGGSGLACVSELLRLGASVVGIDAVGISAGAAGRNGGFLMGGMAMFHHLAIERFGRERAAAIYRATLDQLERVAEETPEAVRRTGSLRIAASAEEESDCQRQLRAMRDDDLPVEPYAGPEGRGLLFPRDAAFDPAARCRALASSALERGARLFDETPAVEIEAGLVQTPRGTVRSPRVIVAVDGKLERLLPELAPRVRSARLQILATEPLDAIRWTRPVYTRWGLDYWQQRTDRRLVLGGCRDIGGDGEWTTSSEPTSAVQSAIERILRDELGVNERVTHRWAATVSYADGGLPIAEQVRSGVWAIGAYSGTGNVIGAMLGRAAARAAVSGGSSSLDLFRR